MSAVGSFYPCIRCKPCVVKGRSTGSHYRVFSVEENTIVGVEARKIPSLVRGFVVSGMYDGYLCRKIFSRLKSTLEIRK